ncbi:MAG: type II toxin-antitoxin system prevent-host-death family antitoxin [Gammaproteobacteria bacterium]|nr:type II toxin-antitoxin system prevent-host-death family antitoxin [Gammaproteobacteria bacterium]
MSDSMHLLKFSRARLSGRQISELLGLCRGLIADGKIVQSEAESLYAWLIDQEGTGHPLVQTLRMQVGQMLEDGVLDASEGTELKRLVCGLIDNRPDAEVPLSRDGMPTNNLDDYQISALLGLCRGLIADGKIGPSEAETLNTWLIAQFVQEAIMEMIGTYEAKTHLPKLLDRVARGENLTITRHGKPVARLVPIATDQERAQEALDRIAELRQHIKLAPLAELMAMTHEGHRY